MLTQELRVFAIFVILAVIRTILDIVLWQGLVLLLKEKSKIVVFFSKFNLNRFAIAQALSFLVSSAVSYFSNKEIAFSDSQPDSVWLITKFGIVTGIGLVASVWAIEILTSNPRILKIVDKYPLAKKHWPLIAKLMTIGITLVINYTGMRFWVFN